MIWFHPPPLGFDLGLGCGMIETEVIFPSWLPLLLSISPLLRVSNLPFVVNGLSVARNGGFFVFFHHYSSFGYHCSGHHRPRCIFCGYFSGFPHRGLLLCRTSSSQLWRRWRQLLLPGLVVLFVPPPIMTAAAVDAPLRVNQ